MTEQEAIKDLSENLKIMIEVVAEFKCFDKCDEEALVDRIRRKDALEIAIEALKEVQKYRKVGTAEECQKAVNYMHSSTVPVSLYDTRYHVDSYDPCNGCPMASCDDFYAQNPCYHCGRR